MFPVPCLQCPSGRTLIHPSTHPLIHPSTHPLIHSSTHPLIHSSTHPLIHSSTHPLIHSSIHPFIHSSADLHSVRLRPVVSILNNLPYLSRGSITHPLFRKVRVRPQLHRLIRFFGGVRA